MRIEIISVVEKDCVEVTTTQPLPLYRRYGPDHWCHYLGDLHGWNRYTETEFLEEAYQTWLRNEQQAKTTNK